MSTFEAIRPGFGFEKPAEGNTNDWLTPPKLVEMLGHFDLDPCGCPTSPFKLADKVICPPDDGLSLPWEGRVFCNPPYGPHVGKWAAKMAKHGNGIFLIFSRIETIAWSEIWRTGDAFLFPLGRICFLRANGMKAKSGTAPSALIAYGESNIQTLLNVNIAGAFVQRGHVKTGIKVATL